MFESCYPDMENIWLEPVVSSYREFFAGVDAQIVIDVGTRDGDDAEYLRENLGATRVIAIDANPIAVVETRRRYPSFEVYETAVSDYDGVTSFQQVISEDAGLAGCSSISAKKIRTEPVFSGKYETIEVQVVKLETLLNSIGLDRGPIDVVKIDVEGFTYETLVGMGRCIKNVKVLHLETETDATHPNHKNNLEVASLMQKSGFALVDVSYEWGFGIQDQVWVNKRLVI